jgi:hypothetical protein
VGRKEKGRPSIPLFDNEVVRRAHTYTGLSTYDRLAQCVNLLQNRRVLGGISNITGRNRDEAVAVANDFFCGVDNLSISRETLDWTAGYDRRCLSGAAVLLHRSNTPG